LAGQGLINAQNPGKTEIRQKMRTEIKGLFWAPCLKTAFAQFDKGLRLAWR
jgi:hypothetical protein